MALGAIYDVLNNRNVGLGKEDVGLETGTYLSLISPAHFKRKRAPIHGSVGYLDFNYRSFHFDGFG